MEDIQQWTLDSWRKVEALCPMTACYRTKRIFGFSQGMLPFLSRVMKLTNYRPNMGGKSTFLRQNALICVLAQAGQFVPARYAEIGVIDQLFSRVGCLSIMADIQLTLWL